MDAKTRRKTAPNSSAYSRHKPSCLRENKLRVALIGVGALGSSTAIRIAAREWTRLLHIEQLLHIDLIDPDHLAPSNIPLSEAFMQVVSARGEHAIGQPKAQLIAHHLRSANPRVRWSALTASVAEVGWCHVAQADMLVTCTDSVVSRIEAAYACRALGLPMLDAGVHGEAVEGGRVAVYAAHADAACYLCGLTSAKRAEVLAHLSMERSGCATVPLAAAMGDSWQTAEAVSQTADLLVNTLETLLPSLLASSTERSLAWQIGHRDASELARDLPWRRTPVQLTRAADCPWHDPVALVTLRDHMPLAQVIPPAHVLVLPWAVALGHRCSVCGAHGAQPRRLADLRMENTCDACGASGSLEPQGVLDELSESHPAASLTPAQLGLPAHHMLPVRRRISAPRWSTAA